jgi:hypothetical protein
MVHTVHYTVCAVKYFLGFFWIFLSGKENSTPHETGQAFWTDLRGMLFYKKWKVNQQVNT